MCLTRLIAVLVFARLFADPPTMFTELSTALRRRVTKYGHEAYSYSLPGGFARDDSPLQPTSDAQQLAEQPEVDLHQRTLLVTDAASDLPADWRAQEGIVLLPMKLRNREISRLDHGDDDEALRFASKQRAAIEGATLTLAPTITTTGELIGQQLRDETDFVLQIAMSSMRSNCYANSLTAAQKLMVMRSRDRRRSGNTRPFKMWVVDSRARFNGHGVLVAECARLLRANVALPQTVQQIDGLRQHVKTLVVPRELSLFHRSGALSGGSLSHWLARSVGQYFDRVPIALASADDVSVMSTQRGFEAAANHAIARATRSVEAGLEAAFVCASYAGDIDDLRQVEAFAELAASCEKHGIILLTGAMSMTNAAILGGGSLLLSFASQHDVARG